MSTEAEIVEYEGRRYRVAGKSGPGVEPKVGMVTRFCDIRPIDNARVSVLTDHRTGGYQLWRDGAYEILVPIDASPPAETPRCEAPEWCGLPYSSDDVLSHREYPRIVVVEHDVSEGICPDAEGRDASKCPHPAYCSPACADRARDAAGRPCHGCMGERGHHLASCPFAKTASPIPAGYRLAKGWEVLKMPGWFNGDAWFCFAADADDCPGGYREPALLANRRDRIRGACLDCAERRGAIERVEDRQGLEALAGEVREKLREIGASPAAPCLSHHPELGSRCEAPPGPHDMHIGRRPGTAERCEWWDALAPAETRAERWRRTHPGYEAKGWARGDVDRTLFDHAVYSTMCCRRMTSRADGCEWKDATNHKPAPWQPSDPDGDIPNAWEVGRKAMRPWR